MGLALGQSSAKLTAGRFGKFVQYPDVLALEMKSMSWLLGVPRMLKII